MDYSAICAYEGGAYLWHLDAGALRNGHSVKIFIQLGHAEEGREHEGVASPSWLLWLLHFRLDLPRSGRQTPLNSLQWNTSHYKILHRKPPPDQRLEWTYRRIRRKNSTHAGDWKGAARIYKSRVYRVLDYKLHPESISKSAHSESAQIYCRKCRLVAAKSGKRKTKECGKWVPLGPNGKSKLAEARTRSPLRNGFKECHWGAAAASAWLTKRLNKVGAGDLRGRSGSLQRRAWVWEQKEFWNWKYCARPRKWPGGTRVAAKWLAKVFD